LARDADFPASVIDAVSKRAGLRCSVPSCDATTSGPGAGEAESANVGTACHIYAASDGGPRGTGGLGVEARKSISNAIWCCGRHGRLIDTNEGGRYPAELLKQWKRFHEARIAKEMSGQRTELGWVDHLEVVESPLFSKVAKIELSKCTLLYCSKANGKTAICEWIGGFFWPDRLDRWRAYEHDVRLNYFAPEPVSLKLDISDGEVRRFRDGQRAVDQPPDLSIVHLPEDVHRAFPPTDFKDDLSWLSAVLDASPEDIQHLCTEVRDNGHNLCRLMEFRREPLDDEEANSESGSFLYVAVHNPSMKLQFGALATSEQFMVLAQLAAALARMRAKHKPTLLLIDAAGWNWGEGLFEAFAPFIAREPYQTVLTYGYRKFDLADPAWKDWGAIELQRDSGGGSTVACIERATN